MKALLYRYQLDGLIVSIEDLLGGESVYLMADTVLGQIETEIGSLAGKHILWQGEDGFWDLLLPDAPRLVDNDMAIYPLSGQTLEVAKQRLRRRLTSGWIPGKIP